MNLRRIVLILSIALIVAVVAVATAGPSFAKLKTTGGGQWKYNGSGEKIDHRFK